MKKIILGVAFLGFFGILGSGEAGAANFGANAFDLNQAAATLELGQNRPQYLAQVDTELRGDATDFTFFLQKIIKILVTFAGAVAVILLIINGLILVTAAGEEDRINTAKKGLTWAGAGLVLITFAYLIAKTAIWVTFIAEIGEEEICKDPVPYPCYGDDNNRSFFCPEKSENPWGINPSPATCNAATGNDECTTRSLQQALWEDGMYHKNAGADYTQSQAVDGKYGRKSQKALFELKKSLNCKDSICDEEIPKSCFEENGELTESSAVHCYAKHDELGNEYFKLGDAILDDKICTKLSIGENEEDIDETNYYYDCTLEQFLEKYKGQENKFEITPWADGKIPDEILDSVFWRWTWSGDREPADSLEKTLTKLNEQLIYSIDSCKKASQKNRQYDYCTEFALKNWQNLQCNGEFDPHPICEMEIITKCGKEGDPKCKSFYTDNIIIGFTRIPNEWVERQKDGSFKEKIPEEICNLVNINRNCTIKEVQAKLDFSARSIDGIYGKKTYDALIKKQKESCTAYNRSSFCTRTIRQQCRGEKDPNCTNNIPISINYTPEQANNFKEIRRIPIEWFKRKSDGSVEEEIPEGICNLVNINSNCTIREIQKKLDFSVNNIDGIYGKMTYDALVEKQKAFCEFNKFSHLCTREIRKECGAQGNPRCVSTYETERIPNEWVVEESDENFKQNIPKRVCFLAGAKVGCTIRDVQQELKTTVDGIYGTSTYNKLKSKNKKRFISECKPDMRDLLNSINIY